MAAASHRFEELGLPVVHKAWQQALCDKGLRAEICALHAWLCWQGVIRVKGGSWVIEFPHQERKSKYAR